MKQLQDEGVFKHLKLSSKLKWGLWGWSLQFFLLRTSGPAAAPAGALETSFPSKSLGDVQGGAEGQRGLAVSPGPGTTANRGG